jgi:integrase
MPKGHALTEVQKDGIWELRAQGLSERKIGRIGLAPKTLALFRFLASTGLRVSEVAALQSRHLSLDGARPHVRVRQQLYRGRLQPPKSRHGRRDVPLDRRLIAELRTLRAEADWSKDNDLVFANEVGAPWAAFHTFRHTCASLLFERGASAVQVQRWLGHHSAAFTLST